MDYQIDRHLIDLNGIDYSIVGNFQFVEWIGKTTNRFHPVVPDFIGMFHMRIRILARDPLDGLSYLKPTLLQLFEVAFCRRKDGNL